MNNNKDEIVLFENGELAFTSNANSPFSNKDEIVLF